MLYCKYLDGRGSDLMVLKNDIVLPCFNFDSEFTILYKDEFKIIRNKIEYDGTAEIRLDFKPKAKINIYLESDCHELGSIIEDKEVYFWMNNTRYNVYVVSSKIELSPVKTKLKLILKNDTIQIVSSIEKEAKYITFHLFNFFDLKMRDKSEIVKFDDGWSCRLDYFYLENNTYKIKIQSTREVSKNIEKIKEDGISRLTQVGRVEKKDGLISIEEYKELEEILKYFLSFAKGSWINPSCSIAENIDNETIWDLFNSPREDYKTLNSWIYPQENSSSMSELFPLFINLWEKERWKNTLKEVFYWFLNANDGGRGIDTGLILAQTALERLSFEYVVNEKKLLSVNGFKDIWASDKFRILFSSLDIPLNIPSELLSLSKESKNYNWLDAPHALTEIRNSLVHPEHKKRGKFDFNLFKDAHTLSLWYLEITILALCKFKGKYSNRIRRGEVEFLPYISND